MPDEEWASWSCATCQVEHEDPVSIQETTCSAGHVNYLGPILQPGTGLGDAGLHRAAFKTAWERRKWKEKQKHIHDTVQAMLGVWSRAPRHAR